MLPECSMQIYSYIIFEKIDSAMEFRLRSD